MFLGYVSLPVTIWRTERALMMAGCVALTVIFQRERHAFASYCFLRRHGIYRFILWGFILKRGMG